MPVVDRSVFPQNVIAVIWDFDKTLIPGNMQAPMFKRYGMVEQSFWDEANKLAKFYGDHGHPLFQSDIGYLSHILTYVREGKFRGLSNNLLRELGGELEFYPGLPEFFPALKAKIEDNPGFAKYEIKLEHYIVSTGLRQMILGSSIAEHVDGVWACEMLGITAPPGFTDQTSIPNSGDEALVGVAYSIDNTTKTRAIFEINKGVNKHPEITVNAKMEPSARRVPIEHMIYVADGPSDIPVFSILGQYGGKTFAVYEFGPADYRASTHTYRCITDWAMTIAGQIAAGWRTKLEANLGNAPQHIASASEDSVAAKARETAPTLGRARWVRRLRIRR
jgi:hypothetical protein